MKPTEAIPPTQYCANLFEEATAISCGPTIYLGFDMEPWQLQEIMVAAVPKIRKSLPAFTYNVGTSRSYDVDCGGWCYYGVLSFDVKEFGYTDIDLIQRAIRDAMHS